MVSSIRFPQNIPTDIDFKVMLTFLEFYTTLVQFVLYRLYTEAGLVYPPKVDEKKMKGIGGLSAFILQSREQEGAKNLKSLTSVGDATENNDDSDSEMESGSESENEEEEETTKPNKNSRPCRLRRSPRSLKRMLSLTMKCPKPKAPSRRLKRFPKRSWMISTLSPSMTSMPFHQALLPAIFWPSLLPILLPEVSALFPRPHIFVGREVPSKIVEF